MNKQEATFSSPTPGRSLGQALRKHHLHLGLSQEALAEAIGILARSIRRWELDQAIPQACKLDRFVALVPFGRMLSLWA